MTELSPLAREQLRGILGTANEVVWNRVFTSSPTLSASLDAFASLQGSGYVIRANSDAAVLQGSTIEIGESFLNNLRNVRESEAWYRELGMTLAHETAHGTAPNGRYLDTSSSISGAVKLNLLGEGVASAREYLVYRELNSGVQPSSMVFMSNTKVMQDITSAIDNVTLGSQKYFDNAVAASIQTLRLLPSSFAQNLNYEQYYTIAEAGRRAGISLGSVTDWQQKVSVQTVPQVPGDDSVRGFSFTIKDGSTTISGDAAVTNSNGFVATTIKTERAGSTVTISESFPDENGLVTIRKTTGADGLDGSLTTSVVSVVDENGKVVKATDIDRCFATGVKVLTAAGSEVPIEHIRFGDYVMAFDTAAKGTGPLVPKQVRQIFRNTSNVFISFMGVTVTPNHQFLTASGEFVEIGKVLLQDGAVVASSGTVIRARTGVQVGSAEDQLVRVRCAMGKTKAISTVLVRAGVPCMTARTESAQNGRTISLLEIITCSGMQIQADGSVVNTDGRLYDCVDWPGLGREMFDPAQEIWIVADEDGNCILPTVLTDMMPILSPNGLI